MARKISVKDKRRCNITYKLRKQGCKINTSKKTIYSHFDNKAHSPYVIELMNKYNYALQYEM